MGALFRAGVHLPKLVLLLSRMMLVRAFVAEELALLQMGALGVVEGAQEVAGLDRVNGVGVADLGADLVAACMLFVAAILEGFFRQTINNTNLRYSIGWGIGLLWLIWFALGGRTRR